jgi:glycosyltransferase involved in cell wall biosynthesis
MSHSNKAIVSVTNDLYTDQRVHKICVFLEQQGYSVLLVGRKRKHSKELPLRSYKTKRMRLFFDKGALFYAEYNLRLFFLLLFKKSGVLVANDLDTLLANYLAAKFKKSTRLVYDSHEYFTEVPELINRPKVQAVWLKIERHIFPKLKTVSTVNSSIAEIYTKKYGGKVYVVRNISNLWQQKKIATKESLGIPENKPLIIIQGAGINVDRGAEEAVEAMVFVDAVLMIVGDGDVIEALKSRVNKLNIANKVLFYGKKPYDVMMNYTHYASIGLTLDKDTNLNYKFSLPNKVFDYIHTSTPIIATNILEVSKVIKQHEVGEILTDFNPENLALKINELLNHPDKLAQYKNNCLIASKIENWEKETETLALMYPKIES